MNCDDTSGMTSADGRLPIAWCCIAMWQTGNYWPNDCFTEKDMGNEPGWIPVYASGVQGTFNDQGSDHG